MRFVPIARARLCFLPRKGEFSAFLTLFGEKSHQRVRARKAPKPLRRKKLFSLHAQKSALCHSSTLSNSRPSRHRLFPVEFHSRARVLQQRRKKMGEILRTLRVQRRLPGFVLRHFLDRVLLASLAIRSSSFWNLCMMFGRDRVGLVSGNFSLNYHWWFKVVSRRWKNCARAY